VDRCFEAITAEVHRFEGTINQYTGDGVMALFGAPIAHEDSARRAVHAALGIQREYATLTGRPTCSPGLRRKPEALMTLSRGGRLRPWTSSRRAHPTPPFARPSSSGHES
jgi:class 3 adenylate cyclase